MWTGHVWKSRSEPTEHVSHEIKEYTCREVKHHTKDQLIQGIHRFSEKWVFTRNLHKVILQVIVKQGGPTLY